MKKILSLILLISALAISLVACSPDNTVINIGVMNGPTGMGMSKLMSDNSDGAKYKFKSYSEPTIATPDLINGTLDMLCLPTNLAANISQKADISVLAINTLGSLFIVTDKDTSISDIKDLEGKTIYASVPTSTTGPIINYLLAQNNVNATVVFEPTHDALVAKVVKNEVEIAILPEPKTSVALTKNANYSVDINLSTEWDKVSDTPLTMGCIVVRSEFLEEHESVVEKFLKEYKSSIEYVSNVNSTDAAQIILDQEIIPAQLPIVQKALNNLRGSIVYIDGADMKAALEDFYAAIKMNKPSDDFYYE